MTKGRNVFFLIFLLLISACTGLSRTEKVERVPEKAVVIPIPMPKSLSSILMDHGLTFYAMKPERRLAECNRLSGLLKESSVAFNQVELAMFIGLESGCGTVKTAIGLVDAVLVNTQSNHDFHLFAQYQLLWLHKLNEQQAKESRLRKKLKYTGAEQEDLEQKLKALKSIEESINERIEVQPNE